MYGGGNSLYVYSIRSRLMMPKLFVVAQEHCFVVVHVKNFFVSHFSLCVV